MRIRLLVPIMLLALLAGCAQSVGDIDRTQPNLIPREQFDGIWYYQRTVVDVPSGNGFTFVGSADFGGLDVVSFDLQESVLLVRRHLELIDGADDLASQGAEYEGEVVAAFPVQHIDVQRGYTASTGEQNNVISENMSDREWYERDYVRVQWGQDLVHDLRFDFNRVMVEPLAYYPQDEGSLLEHPEDAPHFDDDGNYFDLTVRLFARASTINIEGFGEAPSCWLFGEEFSECGSGEYAVRHSFQRRDERQYVPEPYKGAETDLFGFFTADRMSYDPLEGIREQNRTRYLTRHNMWVNWYDETTCHAVGDDAELDEGEVRIDLNTACTEIPVASRTLRPIVYHVNTDFPDDLKPIAAAVGDQWNGAFNDVVTAQGYSLAPGERTFIVCPNNPIQDGDPAQCGEVGYSPRLGDIRYSFMAYIPKFMQYGLLGLGPSNNDPVTGEIRSGMAYVYHHNNLAAYNTARMIELLAEPEGSPAFTEFIDGIDISEWADEVNGRSQASSRTFDLEDADYMVEQISNGWMSQYWEGQRRPITAQDIEQIREQGFESWVQPHLQNMYDLGILNGEAHSTRGRLEQLRGTYIEDLLLTDEVMSTGGQLPGQAINIDNDGDGTPDHIERSSVARGGFAQGALRRDELRQQMAAERNMYLPEMADDALLGLAREFDCSLSNPNRLALCDQGPEARFEAIYNSVRTSIYTAVLAHEVGHSLGLMHNFGGSDDVFNYHDEYWQIRDDGNVGPRTEDPITDEEINASIYNYAYSSVMDYAGRYTIDGLGIGKYDRAAMLFGYGNMIEVYENSGRVTSGEMADWHGSDGDIITGGGRYGLRTYHYTDFWNRMGDLMWSEDNRVLVDVDDFDVTDFSTVNVNGESYNRVPYIYCSHNSSNLSDHCLTRDQGADSMERMSNIIDDLNTWYILRNFPRGRIGVNTFNYVDRYYGRVFNRLKNWNNLYGLYAALLQQFFTPSQMEDFMTDTEEGFGVKTWAVQNAFNYLMQTLLMPDVAAYDGASLQPDGSVLAGTAQGFGARFDLDISDARYYSTNWSFGGGDGRDCGYMWYECLHHVGFYLDKIMAIEALTDSATNFVARSTPEDIREWEVSFYSTFPDQVAAVSQALMSQNFETVAPTVDASGELIFPNYAGRLDAPQATPVDPAATFTLQLYWQVLGQARFPNNYDRAFVDESRIFELGGNAPELAAGSLITFTNSENGLQYGAIDYVDRLTSGESMIRRARCLDAIANWSAGDDVMRPDHNPFEECPSYSGLTEREREGATLATGAVAEFELRQYIDLLEIMADLSVMMDYGDPYNP